MSQEIIVYINSLLQFTFKTMSYYKKRKRNFTENVNMFLVLACIPGGFIVSCGYVLGLYVYTGSSRTNHP